MFKSLESFLAAWEVESDFTSRILAALTDESLDRKVAPGHRDARRLAWHIVITVPEMMGRTGLSVEGAGQHDAPPDTARQIVSAYADVARSLVEQVTTQWTDRTLEEVDDMYGESWSRGRTLGALLLHQAHHRGQLTVLMRQEGLNVPGTHGPSLEEWGQWGVSPPEV